MVLELFSMFLFPGVYDHWQKYLLDRCTCKISMNYDVHCYDVTNVNTSVIVTIITAGLELVFRKFLGGEFVTTTVKYLPDCLSACVSWQG